MLCMHLIQTRVSADFFPFFLKCFFTKFSCQVQICCCRQPVWPLLAVYRLLSPKNFRQVMAEIVCLLETCG